MTNSWLGTNLLYFVLRDLEGWLYHFTAIASEALHYRVLAKFSLANLAVTLEHTNMLMFTCGCIHETATISWHPLALFHIIWSTIIVTGATKRFTIMLNYIFACEKRSVASYTDEKLTGEIVIHIIWQRSVIHGISLFYTLFWGQIRMKLFYLLCATLIHSLEIYLMSTTNVTIWPGISDIANRSSWNLLIFLVY